MGMRTAFKLFLFECFTIKTDQVMQAQAEKNVSMHEEQKFEPHTVLEQDARTSSRWPYKKKLQLWSPKFGNLCSEYLLSNKSP